MCFSFTQAVVWFLARWVDTYLMPVDGTKFHITSASDESVMHGSQSSKRILLDFAGEHKQGEMVLDIISQICINALTSYPGEKELQVNNWSCKGFWKSFLFYFILSCFMFLLCKCNQNGFYCDWILFYFECELWWFSSLTTSVWRPSAFFWVESLLVIDWFSFYSCFYLSWHSSLL